MTREDFVTRVRHVAYDEAVSDTISNIERPPGRRPPTAIRSLSAWYNGLSHEDKNCVISAMSLAARSSLFRTLSILDGVTSIRNDGDVVGQLELLYVSENQAVRINDMRGRFLHELFAAQVPL